MPKFIAEHSGSWSEQDMIAMAKEMLPKIPPGFSWKQTYCDFAGKKFYCDWEAPSQEALEQAFKANNIPFDLVRSVKLFETGQGDFA
jgi:hypothetical protein